MNKSDPKTGTASFTPSRKKVAPTETFRQWIFLKNAYFEDASKMASKLLKIAQKRSQNDPKMVQDCFKLPKIAPKTAQDSPKWVHKAF